MILALSLIAGTLFGLGLVVSGMSNPAKVIGFLDVAGAWDPTLLVVMAGALAVTIPGFRLLKARPRPLFAEAFQWPTREDLDARLMGGAALFGVGWGIAGFCPGPAFTALATGRMEVLLFVGAMIGGAVLHRLLFDGNDSSKPAASKARTQAAE